MSTVTCHDYAVSSAVSNPSTWRTSAWVEGPSARPGKSSCSSVRPASPCTTKDPSTKSGAAMIRAAFPPEQQACLRFAPLRDFPTTTSAGPARCRPRCRPSCSKTAPWPAASLPPASALIGHFKDRSSEYLRMFPQWKLVEAPDRRAAQRHRHPHPALEAQGVSPEAAGHWMLIQARHAEAVHTYLRTFATTGPTPSWCASTSSSSATVAQFASLKWPPVFVTADAVVVHSAMCCWCSAAPSLARPVGPARRLRRRPRDSCRKPACVSCAKRPA